MSSPTQKAIALLTRLHYSTGIVEKWNPHGEVRQDLYGFLDLLAHREERKVLQLQVTSWANVGDRVKKIVLLSESEKTGARIRNVVGASGTITEVWGFKPKPPKGKPNLKRVRILFEEGKIIYSEPCVHITRGMKLLC